MDGIVEEFVSLEEVDEDLLPLVAPGELKCQNDRHEAVLLAVNRLTS